MRLLLILLLTGCMSQEPSAPVYNITLTDNSQWVVGENNTTSSTPSVKTEQVAKPTTSADKTTSNMWILYLILILAVAVAGYVGWKKFLK